MSALKSSLFIVSSMPHGASLFHNSSNPPSTLLPHSHLLGSYLPVRVLSHDPLPFSVSPTLTRKAAPTATPTLLTREEKVHEESKENDAEQRSQLTLQKLSRKLLAVHREHPGGGRRQHGSALGGVNHYSLHCESFGINCSG
jgi:hypothetical protein